MKAAKKIRTFEKEVSLKTSAQYSDDGKGALTLLRWRVEADGEAVGAWRSAGKGTNGGWAQKIDVRGLLG